MVLLILSGPEQLNLNMQLPVRLEVQPDLMEGLLGLADEVGQGELAVGDEVVRGHGGTRRGWRDEGTQNIPVEHSEPNLFCRTQKIG